MDTSLQHEKVQWAPQLKEAFILTRILNAHSLTLLIELIY